MIAWLAPLVGTALGLPFAYGVIRGMRIAFREMEPPPPAPRICPECLYFTLRHRPDPYCVAKGLPDPAWSSNREGDCKLWKAKP